MKRRKSRVQNILQLDISLGVSVVDLVMLTKHFSVMLQAGLTIPEAMDVVVEQATGPLKRVMKRVANQVSGGSSLGDALGKESRTFTPVFVSAVVIGENSGTLAENLKRLSLQMTKDLDLRRQIQTASIYPLVILGAATVLGLGIATFILPQVVGIFRSLKTELPFTTKVLLWIATIFENHGIVLSLSIIGGAIAFGMLVKQKFMRPLVDLVMLNVPVVKNFVHDINRARFCRTIGTLLESGTPITEALEITHAVMPNTIYRKSILRLEKQVKTGESFSEIIQDEEKLYPKMITRMVAVGEEAGGLGETFSYLATFYEERVEAVSKNLSSIIEPVLLIAIGLLVGLLAVSVIAPIYSITTSITI